MTLTYEKLIKFDLIDNIEKRIMDEKDFEILSKFYDISQQIKTEDQFIRECPSYPGATDKIFRSEFISAVGSTLAIEGTVLSKEEIEGYFQKIANNERMVEKKGNETQNSKNAYELIINRVNECKDEFIFSERDIRNIHTELTKNIDYTGNAPGQYRDINPIFGEPPRRSLCTTRHQVNVAMDKFVEWLNKKEEGILKSNIIIKAIMAHYYLAEIHPFGDGNGRTARTLEAFVLYANNINNYCFWSLANFWSANRNHYITLLGEIRNTCYPWELIKSGLEGYIEEIKRIKGLVLLKAKQLMLMDYVRWLLMTKNSQPRNKKINQRIVKILELLTHKNKTDFDKFISSPELKALYYKRSHQTRFRDFDKMIKLGLIRFSKKDESSKRMDFIEPNYQLLEYLKYQV